MSREIRIQRTVSEVSRAALAPGFLFLKPQSGVRIKAGVEAPAKAPDVSKKPHRGGRSGLDDFESFETFDRSPRMGLFRLVRTAQQGLLPLPLEIVLLLEAMYQGVAQKVK